ncbi:MAG TPA: hypothetical protein VKR06_09040, partial [Ktedonosporobacter sp.]|nr:hypothetical protein [Ktedonosporobacter sp.]
MHCGQRRDEQEYLFKTNTESHPDANDPDDTLLIPFSQNRASNVNQTRARQTSSDQQDLSTLANTVQQDGSPDWRVSPFFENVSGASSPIPPVQPSPLFQSQAGGVHGAYRLPGVEHGVHQQPAIVHSAFQKPTILHGQHIQSATVHAAHHQSPLIHAAHHPARVVSQTVKGCRWWFMTHAVATTVTSVLVVATVAAAWGVTHPPASPVGAAPPPPSLAVSGNAISGQSITISGSHFPAGSNLTVSVDGQPLAAQPQRTTPSVSYHSAALVFFVLLLQHVPSTSTPVTVDSQGNFTITVHIDAAWAAGSNHTLQVADQAGKNLAS